MKLVDSCPESRVRNSQPHGIGRVVALREGWAWNNLGRNVVFAGPDLVPRSVYDESDFSDDELSQYDLDVHAILPVPSAGIVVTLNHLGLVRAFGAREVWAPGTLRHLQPRWTRHFVADVERAVVVGERIVGSRPREQGAPGLVVGERLTTADTTETIGVQVELEAIGMASALAAVDGRGGAGLAVGADERVALVPLGPDGVGTPAWETRVDFRPAVLIADGTRLWAAGSELTSMTIDDYDWEARRGGGFAALDVDDGRVVVHGRFADDIAWGNGGVAVVRARGAICALSRTGRLFIFDDGDGTLMTETAALGPASLGIAHADARDRRIVFGFNRGGYRLHTVTMEPPAAGRA